jgi:triacylglycerol esterase/lipase EstA (alpha/beta hydrolase family)
MIILEVLLLLFAMTYRPVHADIAVLSQKPAERIDAVLDHTNAEKLVLIAHSMGGILARYAIKNLSMAGKIDQLITLGSPHMGTRVAAFSRFGKNSLQLLYESDFMKRLAEGGRTPGDIQYTSNADSFQTRQL